MSKFNVEDIKKAKEFLQHFNSFNLEDLELYENRSDNPLSEYHIIIDQKTIEEWKFLGLSNTDFVMMEVYKDHSGDF